MKLLIVLFATLALVSCLPSAEDTASCTLLQQVNTSLGELKKSTARAVFVQNILNITKTPLQFLAVNDDYRQILSQAINFNGSKSLQGIDNWIYSYRQSFLELKDVRVEIRRAMELLTSFQSKARDINLQRSNALTLPFDQKVKTVNETVNQFIVSLPVVDQISEQIEAAVFDFNSYMKQLA